MVLNLINRSIMKYFEYDASSAQMLDNLEGKILLIKLADIRKDFLLTNNNARIILNEVKNDNEEIIPDTIIQTTSASLIRLAMGAEYQSMLSAGNLHIEGDVELANQLYSIFKNIDIDWEEIVSKYIGDAAAYQIGIFAKRLKDYKDRSFENFRLDLSEYLQEESRIVPTNLELEKFLNNVDELEADIDRLEMRTKRIIDICQD